MTTFVKRLLRAGRTCPVSGRTLDASSAQQPASDRSKPKPATYATDWTGTVLSTDNFR